MDYIDRIERLGACEEALGWLRNAAHPDLAAAWAACPRADWLLWLAARTAKAGSPEHRAIVAAAADCAAEVLDLVPSGEDRPRRAVDAARRWARGEATAEECVAAARAARADTVDANNATAAANNAALAAVRAVDAAYAAADAADAANAAGRSADPAAIVRRHIPTPPTLPE